MTDPTPEPSPEPSPEPTGDYLQPYRDAVERFGPSFEATLWGNEDTQRLRFDVITDLADFTDCVVVDAGCGRGDLAARLLERDIAFRAYIGIDGMTPMIEDARTRDLDRSQFEVADLVADPAPLVAATPDWVVFSGTLNTMDDPTARSLIGAAFDAAAQGVVFNFLSDRCHERWTGRDLTPARRFDTVAWVNWALWRSSRVAFRQDYLDGHDATILIQHDGSADE